MNFIRAMGLFIFLIGGFLIMLSCLFRIRIYRFGMSLFVLGTTMVLLPLAAV
nr:hypothetical protein [uncultured Sphaerochaeta sp.]